MSAAQGQAFPRLYLGRLHLEVVLLIDFVIDLHIAFVTEDGDLVIELGIALANEFAPGVEEEK